MHPTDLPQYAIDGCLRRRGRLHAIEEIDPSKTALVVIDMQNVFMQEGAPAEVPVAREIVPNINKLAEATRDTGGRVVWVQMTHSEQVKEDWSVFYSAISRPERASKMLEWLSRDSEGQSLWPDLDAQNGDLYVEKSRYSAFVQGSSNIDEVLKDQGIDTVLIVGTLTNVCCESSARDAMMLDYKVLLVSDGNAAPTDEEHTATLGAIAQVFGDVYSTDELIDLLQKGGAGASVQTAAE